MAGKTLVKFTANFGRNLEAINTFLLQAEAPHAFVALLDELSDIVIPNIEKFPGLGRLFLERPVRSVEVSNGMARLTHLLNTLGKDAQLREYVMKHYLLLYVYTQGVVYLLSIRHHKQLSFNVQGLWSRGM